MATPRWLKKVWSRLKKRTRKVVVNMTHEEYERAVEGARFLGVKLEQYIKHHLPK